jgi:putative ABC transport system permease protein
MKLRDIAIRNLMRRKGKAAFVLAGLVIGVATVVALLSFADGMTRDINHKLEKYGANILIVPKTENLSLAYGGLSLGGFSFEMQEIHENDLEKIRGIKNAANVAAVRSDPGKRAQSPDGGGGVQVLPDAETLVERSGDLPFR